MRKTALILPEATGPRRGQTGAVPQRSLLITGDSSAAGVGVQNQRDALAGHLVDHLQHTTALRWRVIAKTGATTATTLKDLQDTKAEPYDTVVVALGVNDVTRGTRVTTFLRRQRALCDLLRTRFSAQHIILTAVPPLRRFPALSPLLQWVLGAQAERFDAALSAWARSQDDITYLTLTIPADPAYVASDGFHPSAKTYALWAQDAAQVITARWSA